MLLNRKKFSNNMGYHPQVRLYTRRNHDTEKSVVLKSGDGKYAHTVQIFTYKIAYTAHAG
jgi:hypothetical protein